MVALRLTRKGSKDRPYYKIVAVDSRKRRDGRYIEQLGTYDPLQGGVNYTVIEITSSQPIPEEGQGIINISVRAAQSGMATTRGWWRFRGYEEWVREDCGTTVR